MARTCGSARSKCDSTVLAIFLAGICALLIDGTPPVKVETVSMEASSSIASAKDKDITVRISNFELPVAIKPLGQRGLDERLAFEGHIEGVNPVDSDVGVP